MTRPLLLALVLLGLAGCGDAAVERVVGDAERRGGRSVAELSARLDASPRQAERVARRALSRRYSTPRDLRCGRLTKQGLGLRSRCSGRVRVGGRLRRVVIPVTWTPLGGVQPGLPSIR